MCPFRHGRNFHKPSANLHYMKSDMGGATAVIGALITAAERKIPVNIIAILPIN